MGVILTPLYLYDGVGGGVVCLTEVNIETPDPEDPEWETGLEEAIVNRAKMKSVLIFEYYNNKR